MTAVLAAGVTVLGASALLPQSSATQPSATPSAVTSDATIRPADADPDDYYCEWTRAWTDLHQVDLSRVSRGSVTIGDWRVPFRESNFRARNHRDPTKTRVFHSAAWVLPLLPERPDLAVDLLLEQAQKRPDPFAEQSLGKYRAADKRLMQRIGWGEGDVTLRGRTVICAYHLTGDHRLLPVLRALANAAEDPGRYYGPPLLAAHNHGLRSDQMLPRLSEVTGWVAPATIARERLTLLADDYWADCGMTREQSSSYQALNMRVWRSVAQSVPGDVTELIDSHLSRADAALAALLRPDSVLESIGESYGNDDVAEEFDVLPGGVLWCPWEGRDGGWAAAHVEGTTSNHHHTLRFGPAPRYHGTPDHGSATWWVDSGRGGVPVLSDPGRFHAAQDAREEWVHSQAGASTFERGRDPIISGTTASRRWTRNDVRYTLTTGNATGRMRRTIAFGREVPVLVATDSYRAKGKALGMRYPFVQRWILAPGWEPGPGHTARHGEHTLDVLCLVDGKRVKPTLTWVEHYPGFKQVEPALEVSCRARASDRITVTAILLVDAPEDTWIRKRGRQVGGDGWRVFVDREHPHQFGIHTPPGKPTSPS